jgi:hypothetical protein
MATHAFDMFRAQTASASHCNCTAAIDLGCTNRFRDAPFHALNNCFFPMLHAFHQAALHNGCIHADDRVSAPFAAAFLLHAFPKSRARLYSHTLTWNRNTASFRAPPPRRCVQLVVPRATQNSAKTSANILRYYMQTVINVRKSWFSIIVFRKRTRRFRDEDDIVRRLQGHGRGWLTYHGTESVVETLRMFGGADTVVGYHGAGLLNVAFSLADRPLVHEITTFYDLKSSKRWRSYVGSAARKWNGRVRQSIQAIPLAQILSANGIPARNASDGEIKNFKWVRLSENNIREVLCIVQRGRPVQTYQPP